MRITMHHVLSLLEREFPKLNLQPYTFEDVERIAKRNRLKIIIEEHPPDILGYLTTKRTPKQVRRTLVINSRLDEIARTFVGFHELGHYFLHVPTTPKQWFFARKCAERTKS